MKVSREKLHSIVDRVCDETVTDEDLQKVIELVNLCQEDVPATWPSRSRRKKEESE